MTTTQRTPLDVLVVSQLASIRRAEEALEQRRASNPTLDATRFAEEVRNLQTKADRLSRMIDAMHLNASMSYVCSGTHIAA